MSKKVSLGFKPYGYPTMAESDREEKKEPPTVYPTLRSEGKAAAHLIDKGCKPGDEFTAKVTFKVTEVRESADHGTEYGGQHKGGQHIELQVTSIEDVEVEKGDKESEESGEEAIDKFLKGKKS